MQLTHTVMNTIDRSKKTVLQFSILTLAILFPLGVAAKEPHRSPNIILILADDLGYGDIRTKSNSLIQTPNFRRIIEEGVELRNFYASANVCTPSRAGLLTGRYPIRSGLAHQVLQVNDTHGLPQEEITIAEILRSSGYANAIVGKWHLGHTIEYWPTNHGFDHFFGLLYSNDMYPLALYRNKEKLEDPVDQRTLTARYTEEVINFIQKSRNQPFFIYLAHTFPHIPLYVSKQFEGRSKAGLYGDVVEELDWSTGQILAELERQGIDNDTLIIFTSDNGPWFEGSNGEYRGYKGSTGDGAYRVPFFARWPAKIPSGIKSSAMHMNIDLLPTISAIGGALIPKEHVLDGKNMWQSLQGDSESPHRVLYFFDNEHISSLRTPRWKLLLRSYYRQNYVAFDKIHTMPMFEDDYLLLFDLENEDPETYSYARENPKVIEEMMGLYAEGITKFSSLAKHPSLETIP